MSGLIAWALLLLITWWTTGSLFVALPLACAAMLVLLRGASTLTTRGARRTLR